MTNNTQQNQTKVRSEKESNELEYSLENEFRLYKNAHSLPVPYSTFCATFGIVGICYEGAITVEIHQQEQEHRFGQGEMIVLLPKQTISVKDKSDDFRMDYFLFSQTIIDDILSGISRFSPQFFIYMRKKHFYTLTDDDMARYSAYYNLVNDRFLTADCIFQREYIVSMVRIFYLDLYYSFKNSILSTNAAPYLKKEKLAYHFFLLILKHYKENKEMSFYAKQLDITPKYLSKVIKDVSGRSAKDWIVEYTLLEIKSLLNSTALNIQEITLDTNFSTQASLGRFFKKHTGQSPSEYRSMINDQIGMF